MHIHNLLRKLFMTGIRPIEENIYHVLSEQALTDMIYVFFCMALCYNKIDHLGKWSIEGSIYN